uniref:Uncharacterized protein n=1 Tax=Lepeophtheirus salmonis TaxID=72036 RepID=A0A0K2V199_LEPSM
MFLKSFSILSYYIALDGIIKTEYTIITSTIIFTE